MTYPFVTIVTAVRNRPQLLVETVECVRRQTVTDWEYILVDDASDDETPDVIKSLMQADSRIRTIRRTQAGGPFVANNDGFEAAQGNYIFNIDSDDLSPAHRIQTQLDFMQEYPALRACISPWWSFDDRGLIPGGLSPLPRRVAVLKWALALKPFASHSSLCIERETFFALGGYSPVMIGGDYELLCKLSRQNALGVIGDTLSYVRRHRGKISRTVAGLPPDHPYRRFLGTHLEQLTGTALADRDLSIHQSVWMLEKTPLRYGLRAIEGWRAMWQNDGALTTAERDELSAFGDYHAWNFLHANLRSQPLGFWGGSLTLLSKRPTSFIALARYLSFLYTSRFQAYRPIPAA